MGRDLVSTVKEKMVEYYSGDSRRVHHFLKVHSFAKLIGECERLPECELEILEIAALVHDIGIKNAEITMARFRRRRVRRRQRDFLRI